MCINNGVMIRFALNFKDAAVEAAGNVAKGCDEIFSLDIVGGSRRFVGHVERLSRAEGGRLGSMFVG